MSRDRPSDGLRIDGMTLRERQEQIERENSNAAKVPATLTSAAVPARASADETARGFKQHDPPWSYLDPDNPEHEHYRQKRAAPVPAAQPEKDQITKLLDFFEAMGKQFPRRQKSLWMDAAREAGIQFTENAFERAWLIARRQKLIIARGAGAPPKDEQAKRRPRKAQSGKPPDK